jgi:hypothetical protein
MDGVHADLFRGIGDGVVLGHQPHRALRGMIWRDAANADQPGDGEVVRGVTKMAPEQKELFAAIGIPTPKVQEFAETAGQAAL